jgi:hypothetical protein
MQATTVFDLNTIGRLCVSAPVCDRIPKTFGLDAVRDIQVLCPMNLSKHVAALTQFTTRTGNPWADSTGRRNTPIAGYRKNAILRRSFRRCWWPNLDKDSAVLGLVQDEPALRAGAASGILDNTCARRSAEGRSAPRNGPLSLTKEHAFGSWIWTGENPKAMVTSPKRSVPVIA